MSRRRFPGRLAGPFAAGTLAAGMLLTACGSPGSSSSSETTPSDATAGASASAAATGEPIQVGIVTSLSGPLQSYGQTLNASRYICPYD